LTGKERWLTVCGLCPASYPWLNNPTGNGLKDRRRTAIPRGQRIGVMVGTYRLVALSATPDHDVPHCGMYVNADVMIGLCRFMFIVKLVGDKWLISYGAMDSQQYKKYRDDRRRVAGSDDALGRLRHVGHTGLR